MNLILSDVEETIMIVDHADGAPDVQGTVNVGTIHSTHYIVALMPGLDREEENEYAVCSRRWCDLGRSPIS